jgi:hypothetical protein
VVMVVVGTNAAADARKQAKRNRVVVFIVLLTDTMIRVVV